MCQLLKNYLQTMVAAIPKIWRMQMCFKVRSCCNVWSRHSIETSVCWPGDSPWDRTLLRISRRSQRVAVHIWVQTGLETTRVGRVVSFGTINNARRPVRCGWASCGMHETDWDGVIWKCMSAVIDSRIFRCWYPIAILNHILNPTSWVTLILRFA